MTDNGIEQQVRALILSCLEPSMTAANFGPHEIRDDFDFRTEGIVDSLGFVLLLTQLEERLGFAIDLADLDPGDLTVLGSLSRHIAAQRT